MSEKPEIEQVTSRSPGRRRVDLEIRISRFRLPPVGSALVLGRRAMIGPKAMRAALEEMMPGTFTLLPVEHPVIEAILLRAYHLRKVPAEKLVPTIVSHVEAVMDETDTMHVQLEVELHVSDRIDL